MGVVTRLPTPENRSTELPEAERIAMLRADAMADAKGPAPVIGTDGVDDATLFRRFRDHGDVTAFEALFSRHRDAVFTYLLALSGNRAIAEDVSQFCWLRLIENDVGRGYRPRPGVSIRSYLYTLGRNRYIDEYKRKHAATRSHSLDDHGDMAAEHADTAGAAAAQQVRDVIEDALTTLPAEQREVLSMWVAGFTIKEMVSRIGAPRDTVLSRKRYGLKKLKSLLQSIGVSVTNEL